MATPLVDRERWPWVKFIRPTPTCRGRYNKDSKRLQQQRNSAVTKQRPYRFQIKTTQSKVIGTDYLRVSTLRTTPELGWTIAVWGKGVKERVKENVWGGKWQVSPEAKYDDTVIRFGFLNGTTWQTCAQWCITAVLADECVALSLYLRLLSTVGCRWHRIKCIVSSYFSKEP